MPVQPLEAIRFDLHGTNAIFKKPDVNTTYFTYNNIHKIALFGLVGAIMGYAGYTNSSKDAKYPEFYEKLKDLKICIVPRAPKGYFSKKIQVFNNSVGYASFEEGGNLVVKEQWLENPKWTIYISDPEGKSPEQYNKLKNMLLNGECVYTPYLGKNDHPASISNCTVIELSETHENFLNCLFPSDIGDLDEFETWDGMELGFIFKEMSPYHMEENYNFYQFRNFTFTDYILSKVDENEKFYSDGELNLVFY